MRKILTISLGLVGIFATAISVPAVASAAECPTFAEYANTTTTLEPYSYSDFQRDLPSLKNPDEISLIGNQLKTGDPAFRVLDSQPGWNLSLLKYIADKGPNIAVFSFPVQSSDAKNWKPFIRSNWDFQEDPEKMAISSSDAAMWASQSPPTSLPAINRVMFRSGISLVRDGLTPGKWGALAIEININGCPTRTIYTKKYQVPQFEIKDFNLDTFIDNELANTRRDPINYLVRKECNQVVENLKSAAKTASSKGVNWSLPNTQTGNLNLLWKAGGMSTCSVNADLRLSPALGDQCLKRINPGSSNYSYQTLKYPCLISIDGFSSTYVQLATFTIAKPSGVSANAVTTCVKGPKVQKISGANAKCPTGYKKK